MIKNYLKIAFRNIVRHKAFAAINIAGLAIGMACSIFILLWVQNELSYDRFHKNAKDIYKRDIVLPGVVSTISKRSGSATGYDHPKRHYHCHRKHTV